MGKTLLSIFSWSLVNICHLSFLKLLNLYRRYAPGVQFQIPLTVLLWKNVPGVHHTLIAVIFAIKSIGKLFRVRIVITSFALNNCSSIRRKPCFLISCADALYFEYCHSCLYFHTPSKTKYTERSSETTFQQTYGSNYWTYILISACASELRLRSALPGSCPRP